MGNYDVDFEGYDDKGSGYAGEEPKRGVYDGVLVSLKDHTSGAGNEGLEWIFEITEGTYKGWRGWVYSNMDSTKWRTQEIVKAIQGGAEKKAVIDTGKNGDAGTESKTVKKAKRVRLSIKTEKFEDEPRARIRNILPYEDISSEGDEDGGKKKKKNKKEDPF